MTDHTPASQAASTNQLSDAYVNAVIQRHGYQSPETVIARLNQWIGLHGGEDSITLLMYEAHKALSKLRAPVAGAARLDLAPLKCPITGRPFFMAIDHPELGTVPTYGGPYDSYTIPYMDGEDGQPWHERELLVRRYDHDLGGWRDDEVIPLLVIHEDVLHELQDAAPQASEAVRDAARLEFLIAHGAWVAWSKDRELCRVFHRDEDGDVEPFLGWHDSARAAAYTARGAIDAAMAALPAQPGAQKNGGSDA